MIIVPSFAFSPSFNSILVGKKMFSIIDLLIEGQVKAKISGLPINGIKVSVTDNVQYGYTDGEGKFSFYTERNDNVTVLFEDIDLAQNGTFVNKDTVLTNVGEKVFLNIKLEEK